VAAPDQRRHALAHALRGALPAHCRWDYGHIRQHAACGTLVCALGLAYELWPNATAPLRSVQDRPSPPPAPLMLSEHFDLFPGLAREIGLFFGLPTHIAGGIFLNERRYWPRPDVVTARMVAAKLEEW
jgi:hypothetical protein